jgi:hypothetical protein
MNVHELKAADPKAFQREYEQWAQHCDPYLDDLVQTEIDRWYEEFGVYVARRKRGPKVGYQLHYYPHFTFEGKVYIPKLMELLGVHDKYLALYTSAKVRFTLNGDWVTITQSSRGNCMVAHHDNGYTPEPGGIFSELDEDTFAELVEADRCQFDVEEAALRHAEELCYDLLKTLEADDEYQRSEGAFIERCECNEVTFELEDVCS